jgi:hypothetical protein
MQQRQPVPVTGGKGTMTRNHATLPFSTNALRYLQAATVASAAVALTYDFFYLPPTYSVLIDDPDDVERFFFLFFTCLTVCFFTVTATRNPPTTYFVMSDGDYSLPEEIWRTYRNAYAAAGAAGAPAIEHLAKTLHWKMKQLNRSDKCDWSSLNDRDREIFRRCITEILRETETIKEELRVDGQT